MTAKDNQTKKTYDYEIYRKSKKETHFAYTRIDSFEEDAIKLVNNDFRLLTLVSSDETELIINRKKIYFIFTNDMIDGSSEIVILEWMPIDDFDEDLKKIMKKIRDVKEEKFYYQLQPYYHEIQNYYHDILQSKKIHQSNSENNSQKEKSPEPYSRVIVGPIHAGIIQPGRFTFDLVGERVHRLKIDLGYTHKGTEKLFEQIKDRIQPENAWKKALNIVSNISGDTPVAHECAYCRAVESIANISPCNQDLWIRAILLELERIVNHINDIGLLARGVSFEGPASALCILREELRNMCKKLTGSRFLKRAICLGGIDAKIRETFLSKIKNIEFENKFETVLENFWIIIKKTNLKVFKAFLNSFWEPFWEHAIVRDRMINIGVMPEETAIKFGAPGLVAKSIKKLRNRDFRLIHPWGPYCDDKVINILTDNEKHNDGYDDKEGDVLSRFAVRLREIESSKKIIAYLIRTLESQEFRPYDENEILQKIFRAPPYSFEIGHCEGWRGEVVYWVMKDLYGGIFRIKVRDPSIINWKVMEDTLNYEKRFNSDSKSTNVETKEKKMLGIACFPLINKSFNLSYSGNDL